MKHLTLFAESRGTGLRFKDELDDLEPTLLGLSRNIATKLRAWQDDYKHYDQLGADAWKAELPFIAQHEAHGIDLANEIQKELGDAFRVSFFSQIKEVRIDIAASE